MPPRIDMIGCRYGRWIVIAEVAKRILPSGQPVRCFRVRCNCGTEKVLKGSTLRHGQSLSCGCYHREQVSGHRHSYDDGIVIGQNFGKWTVLRLNPKRDKQGARQYDVKCECGTEKLVRGYALRYGNSSSCGCVATKRVTTHGMSGIPEYQTWEDIKKRCGNKKHKDYKIYGGRGIRVCDEWKHDFMAFYNHIGPKPSSKHSIDRIDSDGHYAPGNVKWSTATEQANNTSRNRNITVDGQTKSVSQWAREYGVRPHMIIHRLNRGWDEENAVKVPPFLNRTRKESMTREGQTIPDLPRQRYFLTKPPEPPSK